MSVRAAWDILKTTFAEWYEDDALRLAASLAYYTVFSIAPLIVLTMVVLGAVLGPEAARGGIRDQIDNLVGQAGAQVVEDILRNANQQQKGGLAAIVGTVFLVIGATGVFGELQSSLDRIWDVKPKPGMTVRNILKTRLLSLAMVAAIGFLLLVSLLISTALAAAGRYAAGVLPMEEWIWRVINVGVSFAVVTVLFALMFKVLPDARVHWRDVWIGAVVTSALFTLGKALIGLYLGRAGVGSAYGAAGSLVALLVWVYYSALILFFGAEFTQVFAGRFGRPIEPKPHAQRIDRGREGGARVHPA